VYVVHGALYVYISFLLGELSLSSAMLSDSFYVLVRFVGFEVLGCVVGVSFNISDTTERDVHTNNFITLQSVLKCETNLKRLRTRVVNTQLTSFNSALRFRALSSREFEGSHLCAQDNIYRTRLVDSS
jgi:hypothetical protein